MSNNLVKENTEYYPSHLVAHKWLQKMEGELLTFIEMAGLEENQEEALKSKIRQTIWGNTVMKYGERLDADEVIIALQAVEDYRENPPEARDTDVAVGGSDVALGN